MNLRTIHGKRVRDLANARIVSAEEAARLVRVKARSHARLLRTYNKDFADTFASDQDTNVAQD